jgi:sec-independent protein translocase protein TatB
MPDAVPATSDASVQAVVEGRAPAPSDPLIDLPPPPVDDPATEIAESLRREAEIEAQKTATAQHLPEEKSDAKAG